MISQVFGSYAREDADLVARFRAAYRALGIRLFVDTLDIDAGMAWKKFLRDQIEASDLFQLFWSPASVASAEVANEWQHALLVAAERPQETHFIRPVYWTKPPPHPPNRWQLSISGISTRRMSAFRRRARLDRPGRRHGPRAGPTSASRSSRCTRIPAGRPPVVSRTLFPPSCRSWKRLPGCGITRPRRTWWTRRSSPACARRPSPTRAGLRPTRCPVTSGRNCPPSRTCSPRTWTGSFALSTITGIARSSRGMRTSGTSASRPKRICAERPPLPRRGGPLGSP